VGRASLDKNTRQFPRNILQDLQTQYKDWAFGQGSRLAARRVLEQIQQDRIAEYRRDRAKMGLRGRYLGRMALILGVLLLVLCLLYSRISTDPSYRSDLLALIAFVMRAGALGSVLSHAIKLSKQQLPGEATSANIEPPLGIRALMSQWRV